MTAAERIAAISRYFRRRRMARFAAEMGIGTETRVLDIGGTLDNWQLLAAPPRLVLLNTPRAAADLAGASAWVAGDGRALPFRDGAFDVVFSNSVIEHVGDSTSQRQFAREVSRVGRDYWVETPNRWFPVEQHLLTPFVHWLPRRWQRALVPRFNWWRALVPLPTDRRDFYIDHYLRDVRLLGPRQLRGLFPEAKILRECVLGVAKSLVAFRRSR
jgi:hypothetical protein